MSKNQPRAFWIDYYQKNRKALLRSSKTNYYARQGKLVYWIKPPSNYLDFCKNNNLKPRLF